MEDYGSDHPQLAEFISLNGKRPIEVDVVEIRPPNAQYDYVQRAEEPQQETSEQGICTRRCFKDITILTRYLNKPV